MSPAPFLFARICTARTNTSCKIAVWFGESWAKVEGGYNVLNTKGISGLKSALMAGAAFAAVGVAYAQDSSGPVEKVTVTGTRLQKKDFTAISPVTTVTSQTLEQTNTTSVEKLLNDLPSLVPGNTITSNNSGGENFATIDLRGLGPGRTLVLINGQRVPGSSPTGVVDINTIPAGLIERIEVVTGGASAVYGSDALAGAVNFILKKDFEGFEVNVLAGQAERALGETRGIDALMGFSSGDGRGNITFYGSWFHREGVLQKEFDYSRTSAALLSVYDSINGVYLDVRIADHPSEYLSNAQLSAIYGPGTVGFSFLSGGSATPPWGIFTSPGNQFGAGATTLTNPLNTLIAGQFTGANTDCDLTTAGVNVSVTSALQGGVTFNSAGKLVPNHNGRRCRVPDRSAGSSRYNFAPDNFIILPAERFNLSMFGRYDIEKDLTLNIGAKYTESVTQVQLAPTPITSAVERFNVVLTPAMQTLIQTNHADFWEALQTRPIPLGDVQVNNWRSSVIGPRVGDFTSSSLQFWGDLQGEFSDTWSWNVSAAYGRTGAYEVLKNNLGRTQFIQGLRGCQDNAGLPLPGMLPGCVPIDIFGFEGNQANFTPAMRNFLGVNTKTTTNIEQTRVTGYATGDLWNLTGAGSIAMVIGGEYRLDQVRKSVDDAQKNGDIAGFNAEQDQAGSLDVYELFTEVQVPLVADQPFFKYLGIEGGYRKSDYNSSAGVVDTYKYGAEWAPFDFIRFRGIFNSATRAPNVFELFLNGDQGFPAYTDPCQTSNLATQAFCSFNTNIQSGFVPGGLYPTFAAANSQVQAFAFGNPNLKPETSESLTYGFVFQTDDSWFPLGRIRATVDKYDIEVQDFIGSRGAQTILNSCYGNLVPTPQSLIDCQQIIRDSVTGQVVSVDTSVVNSTFIRTEGWDIQFDWSIVLADVFGEGIPGRFSVNELYSIVDSFNVAGLELAGTTEGGIGSAIFDWKSVLTLGYALEDLNFSARWTYVPELAQTYPGGTFTAADGRLYTLLADAPAASYWDMSVQYNVLDSVRLTLSVDNVFDERPPQTVTGVLGGQANIDPQVYDPLGRYYTLSVRTKF